MFRGYDRAKYDVQDPSAWQAMTRDKLLHEQALLTVSRYLNAPAPRPPRAVVAKILAPMEGAEHHIFRGLHHKTGMKTPPGLVSDDKVRANLSH